MKSTILLDLMRADLGIAEKPGPGSTPAIMEKVRRVAAAHEKLAWIAGFYSDDDIPWCGLQMADVVVRAGLQPVIPNPLSARAWAWWGDDLAMKPRRGAIVVLTRAGGGHVGVLDAISADRQHYRLIGGNQSNRVSAAWFPAARVIAIRQPTGFTLPFVPVASLGNLSASEA